MKHEVKLHGTVGSFPNDEWVKLVKAHEDLKEDDTATLRISLNSTGGVPSDALKVYDWLHPFRNRVSVHVEDKCISAAILILLSGDTRTAEPGASFLIHATRQRMPGLTQLLNSSTMSDGAGTALLSIVEATAIISQLSEMIEQLQPVEQRTTRILTQHTKLQQRQLCERLIRPQTFNVDDAATIGLITSKASTHP